jgi:hypothetical protein
LKKSIRACAALLIRTSLFADAESVVAFGKVSRFAVVVWSFAPSNAVPVESEERKLLKSKMMQSAVLPNPKARLDRRVLSH